MSYYSEKYEVMLHDVDAENIARPSTIARLLQETANHQMRDRKPTYHELFNEGKSYILVRFAAQIYEAISLYENVEVKTWICPSTGAIFKRGYAMYSGEKKLVDAYSEWGVVNQETGQIFRVREIEFSNYEEGEPVELTLPIRFRIPKELEMAHCGTKLVGYSDCDMNRHMNNTRYQDMLWDKVPDVEKKRVTGFSLRFMAGGLLGKEIEIYRGLNNEVIPDDAGGEESWYFKTLIDGNTNVEAILNFENLK